MNQPVRVAFLSEHASPAALLGGQDAGGQNVYVGEISRRLASFGYAVDVITRRADAEGPEVVQWAPRVRIVHLAAGPAAPIEKDGLWPLMPTFYRALLAFLLGSGARYALVHGNFWMSGWVATRLAQRLDIPAVQTMHATGWTKLQHQGGADTSPTERIAIEQGIVRMADRMIAQCPAERDELIEIYGAEASRIAMIPSGVDCQLFQPRPKAEARRRIGMADDLPTIVYVGRMLPRKDIRNIVRALAALKERRAPCWPARLLVVGGETEDPDPAITPEIGAVQQLARELGVGEWVRCVGRRPAAALADYYGAGDVAVTTPWYEPYGLTPLEAMACGRPVIGSAVGGITYTIQDGETGRLVPPRNPAALADRLEELLGAPERAEAMGRSGRARVERYFTWDQAARRLDRLYQTLLTEREKKRRGGSRRLRDMEGGKEHASR